MFFEICSFLGGVFLILGAFFLYKGFIKDSIISYFLADLCWLYMAFSTGNYASSFVIFIGIAFGLGVYAKMEIGEFHDDLRK